MDASALVFSHHGMMLRFISATTKTHYQGLRQAAVIAHRRKLIGSTLKARMIAVDAAFQVIRHITEASAKRDYIELCAQFDTLDRGEGKGDTSNENLKEEDDNEEENGLGCNSSGGKCRKRSVLP